MADFLIQFHSGWRWLVLLAVLGTAVWAFGRGRQDLPGWIDAVQWIVRIQVLIGVVLFIMNEGWTQGTFIAMVHPLGMIAAIGVLEAGIGRARREERPRTLGVFAVGSLALMLASVPWFRGLM